MPQNTTAKPYEDEIRRRRRQAELNKLGGASGNGDLTVDEILAQARGTLDSTQGTADSLAGIEAATKAEGAEMNRLRQESSPLRPIAQALDTAAVPAAVIPNPLMPAAATYLAMRGAGQFIDDPTATNAALAALGAAPGIAGLSRGAKAAKSGVSRFFINSSDDAIEAHAAAKAARGTSGKATPGITGYPEFEVQPESLKALDRLMPNVGAAKHATAASDEAIDIMRANSYGGAADDVVRSTGDWIETGSNFQRPTSLSSGAHPRGMRPTPAQEVDHVADFADNAEDLLGSRPFDLVDDVATAQSSGSMDDVAATIRGMNRKVPNAKARPVEDEGADALDALNTVAQRNMAPKGGRARTAHFAKEMRQGTHPATRGAENERFGMGRRRLPELSESELARISRKIKEIEDRR